MPLSSNAFYISFAPFQSGGTAYTKQRPDALIAMADQMIDYIIRRFDIIYLYTVDFDPMDTTVNHDDWEMRVSNLKKCIA